MIFFLLLAGIIWFFLIRSMYDERSAVLSSMLFLRTPYIVSSSRIVMSEIPTVALIIVALFSLHQYCVLGKKGHAYTFSVFMALSVYSKHVAIFMLPVFLIYFVMTRGLGA